MAQAAAPDSRIVYVDNDPIVLAHARALMTSDPAGASAFIQADFREPAKILAAPELLQTLAVIGESGAGKSTLLHLISGLDRATSGAIYYNDRNVTDLPEPEMATFRNREIGYVWQQHHLLPEFNAMENVAMPLLIAGVNTREAKDRAETMLAQVPSEPTSARATWKLFSGSNSSRL